MLSGATTYALVDLRAPGDFSHRDIITLSTADARILSIWHYGENRSGGDGHASAALRQPVGHTV
jgi:hypothetical protein